MYQEFFFAFLLSFAIVFFLTPAVRSLACRLGVFDIPDEPRKIHQAPIPKMGGLAIYFGFLLTVLVWLIFIPESFGLFIKLKHLAAVFLGGAILMIGGYLDDRFNLKPGQQIIFPILAVATIILSGIQLSYINNPLGGVVFLDTVKVWNYPLFGGIFIMAWTLGMIYTAKILDGMDGLVSGIVGMGAVILFFLSQIPAVSQPDTALLSIMFAGAILGFLPWNFHPAKIFLGEGGGTFAGFVLGVLAVIAGGKIATALLIMGIPILDLAWVIIRRLASQYPAFSGDRRHLHFRLLDLGLSQKQTVLFLYILSASFGVSGLFLQSVGKLIALGILFGVMVVLASLLFMTYRRKENYDAKYKGQKLF